MTAEAQTENVANNGELSGGHVAAAEKPKTSSGDARRAERQRSKLDFPYTGLEDAEESAKAIFGVAGTTDVSPAQAATAMGQSASSSTFRVRISAMKLFGVVEGEQGRLRLTDLGRSISEAHTAIAARVEAFARIPLYAKMIELHDGHTLPNNQALVHELIQIGIPEKQADRARQVFTASAKHAGYIKPGSDHFVRPIVQKLGREGPAQEQEGPRGAALGSGDGGDGPRDPVIRALVQKIPPAGSPWGIDEQVMWLRMMAMAFTMAYGSKRQIKIEVEPEITRP